MEHTKRKELLKLLGAFVLGAALMLTITGVNGVLWQGKVMKDSGTTPTLDFTLDEELVDTDCDTTHCDIESAITDLHDQLGYSSWTAAALASQIDDYAFYVIRSLRGDAPDGSMSTWTLDGLADVTMAFSEANTDEILEEVKGDRSGTVSSWTLEALAGQIQTLCE